MGRQIKYKQIEEYVNQFNDSVYHPILNRDLGQPMLDEHVLLFLLLPKINGEKWAELNDNAAIAVGAVQAAFDAHDTVSLEDVTTTTEQLRVLAGDYLSGIYYSLLASVPDFKFIHVLAQSIGRINELKVEFYHDLEAKTSKDIHAIQDIQTTCIVQFLTHYGYGKYAVLAEVGLSLIALKSTENVASRQKGWTIETDQANHVQENLYKEMIELLEEADFLKEDLKEEIRSITMPLLDQTV